MKKRRRNDSRLTAGKTSKTRRLEGLDTLRGLTLLSMMAYHACWDLVWIYGRDWPWYTSRGAFLWQQSICWTFILLSGFCVHLGHHRLWRGLLTFGCGWGITAVTVFFMPESRILFGVLFLLGAGALLTIPLEPVLQRIPPAAGVGLSFFLFLFTRSVNEGVLGFGPVTLCRLPSGLYRNLFTAALGFPAPSFWSTDYFSLLPWLFLFWTGYHLYRVRRWKVPAVRLPLVTAMGRHSLFIYLIHQPVLYGLLYVGNLLVGA